jgi:hypothetical protein
MDKIEKKMGYDFDVNKCESQTLKWEKETLHNKLDKYYGNDHFVRKRTAGEKR